MTSLTKSWIDHLLQTDAVSWLQAHGVDGVFPTRVLSIEGEYLVLENRIPPEYITRVMNAQFYTLHTSIGSIQSQQIFSGGRRIHFPSTEPDLLVDGRKNTRYSFEDNENVEVEILNPFDRKTLLRKKILDLSSSGMSFETVSWSQLLKNKTTMSASIYIENEVFRKVKMEVVYVRRVIEWRKSDRLQAGARFLDEEK
ncbi:MAG: hypothetical protein AB8C84_06245 [Oligoflexales bacterium]